MDKSLDISMPHERSQRKECTCFMIPFIIQKEQNKLQRQKANPRLPGRRVCKEGWGGGFLQEDLPRPISETQLHPWGLEIPCLPLIAPSCDAVMVLILRLWHLWKLQPLSSSPFSSDFPNRGSGRCRSTSTTKVKSVCLCGGLSMARALRESSSHFLWALPNQLLDLRKFLKLQVFCFLMGSF